MTAARRGASTASRPPSPLGCRPRLLQLLRHPVDGESSTRRTPTAACSGSRRLRPGRALPGQPPDPARPARVVPSSSDRRPAPRRAFAVYLARVRLTLVRNATLLVELGGRRILVEPMLDPTGARPPVEDSPNPRPQPARPAAAPRRGDRARPGRGDRHAPPSRTTSTRPARGSSRATCRSSASRRTRSACAVSGSTPGRSRRARLGGAPDRPHRRPPRLGPGHGRRGSAPSAASSSTGSTSPATPSGAPRSRRRSSAIARGSPSSTGAARASSRAARSS